ncbi:MAG: two-component sensor histidine kinase, partial [Porticoccaceae bacterium]
MKSIRSYLVIAVLSAITLTSFVAALYGYRASVAAAQTLFDAQLSDTASLIAALLAAQPPEATPEADRGLTPSAGQAAFQIWTADQRLVLYSADAPTTAIAPFVPGFHDRNFNDQRWRVLVRYADRK